MMKDIRLAQAFFLIDICILYQLFVIRGGEGGSMEN